MCPMLCVIPDFESNLHRNSLPLQSKETHRNTLHLRSKESPRAKEDVGLRWIASVARVLDHELRAGHVPR